MKFGLLTMIALIAAPAVGAGVEPGSSCVNLDNKKCAKNGGHVVGLCCLILLLPRLPADIDA